MKYKILYEKQYGKKKLVNLPQKKYWGLRRLLRKYDWDRYDIAEQLTHPSKIILDIGFLQRKQKKNATLMLLIYSTFIQATTAQHAQIRGLF